VNDVALAILLAAFVLAVGLGTGYYVYRALDRIWE
jgi:uncharacterized protein YneF (UPF0154 family)